MKLRYLSTLVLLFLFTFCEAQKYVLDVAFEFQAYPTGLIPGLRVEAASGKHAGHLRLGYNWIRHGSAGVHQNERGSGFGFSLGYKRYFVETQLGSFVELKSDLWFNEIDWQDNIARPNEIRGRSDVIVSQPTATFGYTFRLNPITVIAPTISLGYEINVWTDGEPTGEGAIFLLGFHVGRRFEKIN